MKPPSGGPSSGPISAGSVTQIMALTSSRWSTLRTRISRATGVIIAPPMPSTMRAATNCVSVPDNAQPIEPSMKTAIAARNTVRAPKRSAVQPLTGMKTASDSRYDGDRELERERAGADIGRDRRQRGGDHGRIHVLHEQGDRHDQRHDAFGRHGMQGWTFGRGFAPGHIVRAGEQSTQESASFGELPPNRYDSPAGRANDRRQPKTGRQPRAGQLFRRRIGTIEGSGRPAGPLELAMDPKTNGKPARSAHLRRRPAQAGPVRAAAVRRRHPHPHHPRNRAQHPDHRLGHGHRHRGQDGDRHGAGRRHRRHPPQSRAGGAGRAGAPGQEVRIRHGGEPGHHRIPARRSPTRSR